MDTISNYSDDDNIKSRYCSSTTGSSSSPLSREPHRAAPPMT